MHKSSRQQSLHLNETKRVLKKSLTIFKNLDIQRENQQKRRLIQHLILETKLFILSISYLTIFKSSQIASQQQSPYELPKVPCTRHSLTTQLVTPAFANLKSQSLSNISTRDRVKGQSTMSISVPIRSLKKGLSAGDFYEKGTTFKHQSHTIIQHKQEFQKYNNETHKPQWTNK